MNASLRSFYIYLRPIEVMRVKLVNLKDDLTHAWWNAPSSKKVQALLRSCELRLFSTGSSARCTDITLAYCHSIVSTALK